MAQRTEIARLEYTYFPGREGNNSLERLNTFVDFPIALNKKGTYLIPRVAYGHIKYGSDDSTIFNNSAAETFQSYQFWLGYTFKMKRDWRFGTRLGLMVSSNFETNKIIQEDVYYLGVLYFVKSKMGKEVEKPWQLIIALSFPSISGKNFVFPIAYYFKKLSPQWSYTVGLPKTNLERSFNKRLSIQLFAEIGGYFGNIQNNGSFINNTQQQENFSSISMRYVQSGLGYEYYLTKNLLLYTNVGYTLSNALNFADSNKTNIYSITSQNTFHLQGGLKFKI